nr:T9SS type A sorting domain-containing protein [Flavilitoribacter sp.]
NPFIDEVRLDTDLKVVKALVYNMNGQLVRQAQVNNNSLNLQGLNSGMYVLLLATADNKFYSQTIVRK